MELSYKRGSSILIGTFEYDGGTRYYAKEILWFGGKLRMQCSVTPTEGESRYSNLNFIDFVVAGRMVKISVPLPDCIKKFKKSAGWGCAEGGPILIEGTQYHCQATLIARPPNDGSYLVREGGSILLCDRQSRVTKRFDDQLQSVEKVLSGLRITLRDGQI